MDPACVQHFKSLKSGWRSALGPFDTLKRAGKECYGQTCPVMIHTSAAQWPRGVRTARLEAGLMLGQEHAGGVQILAAIKYPPWAPVLALSKSRHDSPA